MTGFLFAVVLGGAGCLGRYTPPTGSGASTSTSTSGNGSSSSPAASPDPAPPDGGAGHDASPAATDPAAGQPTDPAPDAGAAPPPTSTACDTLANCCDQLPPNDAAQCEDALVTASDDLCQAILDGLQQNGLCN